MFYSSGWENGDYVTDLGYVSEDLYQKKTGEYFLHGEGGANSRYRESRGNNEWVGGEMIIPLTYDAACEWASEHMGGDDYDAEFGDPGEGDDDVTTTVHVDCATAKILRRMAAQRGKTIGEVIREAVVA